ncbi:hypothetical protein E2P81_ATG04861 [Venturia nashicola]|nr:hypothetical protein E2P81_ATG04861 [Venturia nashicola]
MSIPKAPFELKNHCSTVWNNTVYVYSPDGFQSLSLTEGAKWKTLPSGQPVTGGICAPAMGAGNEALYVVGGSTTTFAPDYSGLQRFDFASGSWENITPSVPVTANRRNHGAQYINSTNSILVYSGSQDTDSNIPSTQTFLISTAPPFSVLSFNSQGAPPLLKPILMPWDQDHAVMVGGSADNKQIWTFAKDVGWQNLGTTLVDPIADQATTQCSIVTGDDSSKVLEVYNLGVTPNAVARYALWLGPDNKAAPTGKTVGGSPSRKRRRELTVNNWPTYNNSLAPTTSRSAYSLAESASGLVVITGGSGTDPIAMFDQRENTWLNATSILVAKNQIPLTSTSSLPSVSTVTPTATSISSPTSNGVVGGSTAQSKTKVLTILGATLGAIFGLAAILVLMLVLLRWRKEKNKNADDAVNEKNGRLSFADQGAEFMHEAGGSRGRAYSASLNSSVTSLQIFSKPGPKSGPKSHTRGVPSNSSQLGLVNGKSPLGANEPMEMSQMAQKMSPTFTARSLDPRLDSPPQRTSLAPPALVVTPAGAGSGSGFTASNAAAEPEAERSRSNGWSCYFANNDVTNLATMQPNNQSMYSVQAETCRTSISRSEYGDSRNMSDPSVRPLDLNLGPKFDAGQKISTVRTASPQMGGSTEHFRDGMSAEIRRAGSTSSRGSDPGDMYESTINTHTTTANYTPQSNNGGWPESSKVNDTRSMTSSYSAESLNPFAPDEKGEYAPDNPLYGFLNSTKTRNVAPSPPGLPDLEFAKPHFGDANRDSSGSAMTVFPSGIGAGAPKLSTFSNRTPAAPAIPLHAQAFDHDFDFPMPLAYFGQTRDSTASDMTVFPGPASPTTAKRFNPPQSNAISTASSTEPPIVENRRPFAAPAAQVPPSPSWRGPVMHKTTGDEDLSWLNLNAGRI